MDIFLDLKKKPKLQYLLKVSGNRTFKCGIKAAVCNFRKGYVFYIFTKTVTVL